jgi:glycosyltransferase involved in cell wall biosynthesis
MSISIIIPAFNAEAYLSKAVESILKQTVADWELIIVNDGSTDSTPALADRLAVGDSRIRVVHQLNTGLPGARNRGYEESCFETEFVIFLDADDLWEPNTLQVLTAALNTDADAVAAHGMARYINEAGNFIRPGKLERRIKKRAAVINGRIAAWPLEKPTTFAVLAIDCYIVSAGSVLIRRSALEKVGLFDCMKHLSRASLEDWDLWLRLCLHGYFAVVPKIVLNYRQHGANLSKAVWLMHQGHIYVRMKLFLSPDLTPEQRCIMRVSNQQAVATEERRFAYYKWLVMRKCLLQRQTRQAAEYLRTGFQHYLCYLRLRHSIAVEEAWVMELLESSIPVPCISKNKIDEPLEDKHERRSIV